MLSLLNSILKLAVICKKRSDLLRLDQVSDWPSSVGFKPGHDMLEIANNTRSPTVVGRLPWHVICLSDLCFCCCSLQLSTTLLPVWCPTTCSTLRMSNAVLCVLPGIVCCSYCCSFWWTLLGPRLQWLVWPWHWLQPTATPPFHAVPAHRSQPKNHTIQSQNYKHQKQKKRGKNNS